MFRKHLCKILAFLPLEGPCELQAIISNKFRTIYHAGAYQMLDIMLAVCYGQSGGGDDRCLLSLLAIVDHKQSVAHRKPWPSRLLVWTVGQRISIVSIKISNIRSFSHLA